MLYLDELKFNIIQTYIILLLHPKLREFKQIFELRFDFSQKYENLFKLSIHILILLLYFFTICLKN